VTQMENARVENDDENYDAVSPYCFFMRAFSTPAEGLTGIFLFLFISFSASHNFETDANP